MSTNDPNNPYAANVNQSAFPVTVAQKPPSITVFGILNLVFGIWGIFGIIMSAIQIFVMTNTEPTGNPIVDMMHDGSLFSLFTRAAMIFQVVLVALLIISGIGLLGGKSYGRMTAIYYAILAIVLSLANTVVIVITFFSKVIGQSDGGNMTPEQAGLTAGLSVMAISGICGCLYPIILLIFMMRRNVKDYMLRQV